MKLRRILGVLTLLVFVACMLGSTGMRGVEKDMSVMALFTPTGNIRDRLPEFSWGDVSGATDYQVLVKVGDREVYTVDVPADFCSVGTCTFVPPTVLDYLHYNWQVRPLVGGIWQPWSPTEYFNVRAPVLKMPPAVIVDQTPRYVWTKETHADSYLIQVAQTGSIIYEPMVSSAACGVANCLYTPMEILPLGTYKWRLRTLTDGVWGFWTDFQTFTIKEDPSFFSQFNTDMNGWKVVGGKWAILGGKVLKTRGAQSVMASVFYQDANFENLRYQVKMKRAGSDCSDCINGIYIRGQVTPFSYSNQMWGKGYLFTYANNGYFSVLEYDSGQSTLQGATYSAAINTYGWNTLRVDAIGSSLKFYINNTLVWSGTDSTHTIGKVGIAMYQTSYPGDILYVDWASASYRNPTP
jgi:hypothetical protein